MISEANLDRQRILQSIMGPVTEGMLDRLPLQEGVRCLDLGCGIGETTRQLAARLELAREVVGIDQDKTLIKVASSMASGQGCPVTFQPGDATRLAFADESFHFVFARYLLHHLDDPRGVLEEMFRVCRPGGIVAVQEPDCAKQYCYPDSWAYESLPHIYRQLFASPFVGRELYSLFRQLGCTEPHLDVETLAGVNVELRRSYRMTIEAVGPALTDQGILTGDQLEELLKELRRVEGEDGTLCVWSPIFSIWGVC
ncbi:MAG: methyltransferase domain-containing protein, partial [Acidobacteriota bacterium]